MRHGLGIEIPITAQEVKSQAQPRSPNLTYTEKKVHLQSTKAGDFGFFVTKHDGLSNHINCAVRVLDCSVLSSEVTFHAHICLLSVCITFIIQVRSIYNASRELRCMCQNFASIGIIEVSKVPSIGPAAEAGVNVGM